jgi:hypothetical protein
MFYLSKFSIKKQYDLKGLASHRNSKTNFHFYGKDFDK